MKYIYDIEVYPNFYSIVFYDVDRNTWLYFYYLNGIWEGNIEYKDLLIVKQGFLIGYNSNNYDIHILNEITKSSNVPQSNSRVYRLSCDIIENSKRLWNNNPKSIDLATHIFNGVPDSLKLMGCKVNHPKLQELPIDPHNNISENDIELIMSYNKNDVEITHSIYEKVKSKLNSRLGQGKLFGNSELDYLSDNDSWLAGKAIKNAYMNITGCDYQYLKSLANNDRLILLEECILEHNRELWDKVGNQWDIQDWYRYYSTLEYPTVSSSKILPIKLNNTSYQLGYGGIHSEDDARFIIPDSGYKLIDADVASQYPNKIVNRSIINPKLDKRLLKWYETIISDRLEYKALYSKYKKSNAELANKYKKESDDRKIVINSFFGKYKQKGFLLYDPKSLLQVTVNNQLEILYLIYMMEINGFEVFTANTDGFTTKVPISREQEYYDICKEWESIMQMDLEYAEYHSMYQTSVNSYIAVPQYAVNDTINLDYCKYKNDFLTDISLTKGYFSRAIPLALQAYFLKDTSIEDYLNVGNPSLTIYDFCNSQKVGKQFKVYYGDNEVQHINRFYISTDGKTLVKKNDDRTTSIVANEYVTLMNDIDNEELRYYGNLKYDYYIKKCYEIIDKIMNKFLITIRVQKESDIQSYVRRTKKSKKEVYKEVEKALNKIYGEYTFTLQVSDFDEIPRYNKKNLK